MEDDDLGRRETEDDGIAAHPSAILIPHHGNVLITPASPCHWL